MWQDLKGHEGQESHDAENAKNRRESRKTLNVVRPKADRCHE